MLVLSALNAPYRCLALSALYTCSASCGQVEWVRGNVLGASVVVWSSGGHHRRPVLIAGQRVESKGEVSQMWSFSSAIWVIWLRSMLWLALKVNKLKKLDISSVITSY